MPFLTQGKTNWKFLLIVIILAIIVGVGTLWYTKRPEKPYQPVEIKKTEKKTVSKSGIGVKVGDWVKYKTSIYTPRNNETQATNPIKAEVTGISGSNVTTTVTEYYKDGHTVVHNETIDISKEINGIVSANLNVGDSRIKNIPENKESYNLTASQILTKSYNGINREVVYFDEETPNVSIKSYYDRKTGFLLESYVSANINGEKVLVQFEASMQLESTNLW